MKKEIGIMIILVIVVAGVSISLAFGGNKEIIKQSSVNDVITSLKSKIGCSCGCNLNLEECAIQEPNCNVRPQRTSEIENLIAEGKTKQEIIELLDQSTDSEETEISVEGMGEDPTIGPENAPVTIIEFSDFQCSFCAKATSTVKQIVEAYGDDVRLIYRDFPLKFHQYAQKAAEAGQCANDQGQFWELHDKMFENQNKLDTSGLKRYAQELKLNLTEFNSCLDSGKYRAEVLEDLQDGQNKDVSGTPTFFINGVKLVGAQPFSEFQRIINQELSK